MTHTVETAAPHYQPHPPHESSPLTSPHNPTSRIADRLRYRLSQRLRGSAASRELAWAQHRVYRRITGERLIAHERNNKSRYPGKKPVPLNWPLHDAQQPQSVETTSRAAHHQRQT